jgi:hypothetical protein
MAPDSFPLIRKRLRFAEYRARNIGRKTASAYGFHAGVSLSDPIKWESFPQAGKIRAKTGRGSGFSIVGRFRRPEILAATPRTALLKIVTEWRHRSRHRSFYGQTSL